MPPKRQASRRARSPSDKAASGPRRPAAPFVDAASLAGYSLVTSPTEDEHDPDVRRFGNGKQIPFGGCADEHPALATGCCAMVMHQGKEVGCIGFVVVERSLVTRRGEIYSILDIHTQETYDVGQELLTPRGTLQPVLSQPRTLPSWHTGDEAWLAEEYGDNPLTKMYGGDGTSKTKKYGVTWGTLLDAGRLVYVEDLELAAEHRGKGLLAHLLPEFVRVTGAACVIGHVGQLVSPMFSERLDHPGDDDFRHEPPLSGKKPLPRVQAEEEYSRRMYEREAKLQAHLNKHGVHRVGTSGFFAYVPGATLEGEDVPVPHPAPTKPDFEPIQCLDARSHFLASIGVDGEARPPGFEGDPGKEVLRFMGIGSFSDDEEEDDEGDDESLDVVQCRGRTQRGARCRVTSDSLDGKWYRISEPLRDGLRYCSLHANQVFDGSSFDDEEEDSFTDEGDD